MNVSVAREQPAQMSAAEWSTRVELAACFRLCAHYGWVDSAGNHLTARIPGEDAFLINPFDVLFQDITASSLLKMDFDGNLMHPTPHAQNPTGFVVHSGFYAARADIGCTMHLHSDAGVAVSCLTEGLLPISQTAMLVADDIAYHDYEGVVLDLSERERMSQLLGQKNILILRNHGTMVFGRTIAQTFMRCHTFESACAVQMKVLASGRPIHAAAPDAVRVTAEFGSKITGVHGWTAHLHMLDRLTTDYQQ